MKPASASWKPSTISTAPTSGVALERGPLLVSPVLHHHSRSHNNNCTYQLALASQTQPTRRYLQRLPVRVADLWYPPTAAPGG